jgi:hypothetical protein
MPILEHTDHVGPIMGPYFFHESKGVQELVSKGGSLPQWH